MTGFGPIFRLQVTGMICPCLLKSEDANARQAVNDINGACRRVQIHPVAEHNTSNSGFLSGFFGRSTTSTDSGENTHFTQPCLAKLILRDSGGDGQPELLVDPIGNSVVDVVDNTEGENGTVGKQRKNVPKKRNVKLRRVDKVMLEGDQVVLKAKPSSSGQAARELLRFTLLQCSRKDDDGAPTSSNNAVAEILPVNADTRNMVVHHFMVATEWERQRRAALHASDPDTYNDDSEDEEEEANNQTNFITARAQKAAHFAKRELEMQKTKRDREQRKAKLIGEAGGLKYTAIAMANMQSPS
jgi:hypothetical protein